MLPAPPDCAVFRTERPGPYVIAEIGVNHGGDLDLAKRLVEQAAAGGADAVKFQTYKAGKIASRHSPSYWDLSCEPTTSQYALFKKYDRFGPAEYRALAEHAAERGVVFLSTPFDLDALEILAPLVPFFKIASADITNFPLLEACAQYGKPILLSTGASYLGEVEEAVRRMSRFLPAAQVGLLHCVLEYPTPYEHAQLSVIQCLQHTFSGHPIGYSDHTRPDPAMAVLLRAWLLGAVVIEKHFTHDKSLTGNDHYHAMDQHDLARFRESCGLLLAAEGQPVKTVAASESAARRHARRSLVAVHDLPSGHVLGPADLMAKRPAHGLPPSALDWVLDRPLTRALAEDEFLTYDHLLGS